MLFSWPLAQLMQRPVLQKKREALERLQRMEYFESQDFDPVENDVERAAELARDQADYAAEESWRWLLSGRAHLARVASRTRQPLNNCAFAVLIGLTMGLCSFIVDISLETLNNWKFRSVKAVSAVPSGGAPRNCRSSDALHGVQVIRDTGGFWGPYLTFIMFCMGYASIAGCLVSFGAPLAAGSGIPEVKTYLNGVHIKGAALAALAAPLQPLCCPPPPCPYALTSRGWPAELTAVLLCRPAVAQDAAVQADGHLLLDGGRPDRRQGGPLCALRCALAGLQSLCLALRSPTARLTLHTCAGGIVGGGIAGMGSKWLTDLSQGRFTFRAPRKYGGYFRNDADHRDFVSIGTAAGEAALVELHRYRCSCLPASAA